MWFAGGLGGATASAYVSYVFSTAGTANLPEAVRVVTIAILVAVAAGAGFLAGAAIFRRARRERLRLVSFASLAAATAGGIIGLSQALALTIAYLANYSTWPSDRLDQVLLLLSYPVFGALGLSIGALVGMALGAALGIVLRVVSPAR
ncbi:MAG: hypothetical protein ACR2JC_15105 [Chloroflexota bacterium]